MDCWRLALTPIDPQRRSRVNLRFLVAAAVAPGSGAGVTDCAAGIRNNLPAGEGSMAAVFASPARVEAAVVPLREQVSVAAFTAELPDWQVAPSPCEVGLSEICFGVRIEESFSRGIDHSYIRK